MHIPNLLIAGAPKAGTTGLAHILSQHPEIFLGEKKEPRYHIRNYLKTINPLDPEHNHLISTSSLNLTEYKNLYTHSKSKYNCDASVHYLLNYHEVIQSIKASKIKPYIIIILREPISRVQSNLNYLKHHYKGSILELLKKEEFFKSNNFNSFWFFKEQSLYYDAVNAYSKEFDNLHIMVYEDFKAKPEYEILRILKFLDLNTNFSFINRSVNKSIKAKFPSFNSYLKMILPTKVILTIKKNEFLKSIFYQSQNSVLDIHAKEKLIPFFLHDVRKLRELLGNPNLWKEIYD